MTLTVKDIADVLGTTAFGDTSIIVQRPAEPAQAGPDDLALAMSKEYADQLKQTAAQAAMVWDGADWEALGLKAAITVPRARLAMSALTQAFDPAPAPTGIHASAVIDPSAHIGADCSIGPFVVIGANVIIGDRTRIEAQMTIAEGVTVGADCLFHSGSRIGRNCRLGDRVILQPNAVVGADGFSFVTSEASNEERAYKGMGRTPIEPPKDGTRHRIHSLGSVIVGDDVELGSNSCIDAGTIRPTQIGRGTKIDNNVQVGHNCMVGEDCVLCGQAAMAGSSVLGDRVVLAGRAGIKDHITVGNDVVVGAAAGLYISAKDGAFMMGQPALEMPAYRAREKAMRRLPQLLTDIAMLQKRVSNSDDND